MRRGAVIAPLVFLCADLSGCAMMDSMANYMKHTLSFTKGTDYINGADEEDEAWVKEAGEEARAYRPRERDPDQWYKQNIMSEKARSIEHNLGID
jgi:hypothetical protein